jgi:hypothetical protein
MYVYTQRIKNLAFALEAISRINGEGSADLYFNVKRLLDVTLNELEKEIGKPERKLITSTDDEIPF